MKIVMAAAQTNYRPGAVAAQQPLAQVQRRLNAYTIKHEFGAARARYLADLLNRLVDIAVIDRFVRAHRPGVLKFLFVDVARNDVDGGDLPQQLNCHMPQAANADNHDRIVGGQLMMRPGWWIVAVVGFVVAPARTEERWLFSQLLRWRHDPGLPLLARCRVTAAASCASAAPQSADSPPLHAL